jgi:hypothetical protein
MNPPRLKRTLRGTGLLVLALTSTLSLTVVGCGGTTDERDTPIGERLDRRRAEVMAQVLLRNHEATGASFQLAARAFDSAGTISLSGIVNWSDIQGRAVVSGASDELGEIIEVAWTAQFIGEYRPSLESVLQGLGNEPGTYLIRPVDQSRRLDQLLAIVSGLASTTADNPQLILQNPGAAFLRTDTLRGRTVDVVRYSERSIFWIDIETGQMLRFEGNDSSGRYPVIVDLLEWRSDPVELPAVTEIPDALRR